MFIIEEITGAGKTEAALTLAGCIMTSGEADGLYFGLPTMATSNAMHGRVEEMYIKLYEKGINPSLVLAHSASRQYLDAGQMGDGGVLDEESDANNEARTWLHDNRKKALLANIGVGTIDQALLAVLPARHQSLRLLGLYRKVLIVDEVHAYDAYMNGLLCNLLKFHSAQGGSAILLSATLPKKLRKEFVKAFADGIKCQSPDKVGTGYPLITAISRDGLVEQTIQSPASLHKEIEVLCTKLDPARLFIFASVSSKEEADSVIFKAKTVCKSKRGH
jgi:CRISPR-associated endonuclease/helicase Cas3